MIRWNGEQLTAARVGRVLGVAALAAYALGAIHAGAAEVAEVRVGTHEKSTRIVLELDRASGYRLVTPEGGGAPELLIHLDATSVARDVPSKSPVVRKVRVEPTANGSTVHVKLATSNVAVKELLLANPPRLVFDLTAQGPIPKGAPEEDIAEEAAPAAEPVVAAEPAKIEKPAEPAPIVVAAAEEKPPVVEKPAAEVVPPPAEAKPSMPSAPIQPVEPMDEPEPTAVPAPAPMPIEKPMTRDASMPPAPKPMPSATSPSAESRRNAIAAKAKPESGSLIDLAMSPIGMVGIGAFAIALFAITVMRRRRSADADEDPLYTVMAADDAAALAESNVMGDRPMAEPASSPIWQPDAFEASEPMPKTGPHQLSLGSRSAPEPEPERSEGGERAWGERSEPQQDEIAPPDDSDSIFTSEPERSEPEPIATAMAEPEREPMIVAPAPIAASAPMASAAVSQETERRISELERRIEQLVEARERLERQVAAQTEELRVQRAAIARTQRVVRSIAKTEDMATEPVPRAPSAS